MVRLAVLECGQKYELIETPPFKDLSKHPEALALIKKHNPNMSVPTLVDGDQNLFETRVICDYLFRKHNKVSFPREIEIENIISSLFTALTTGVQKYMILNSDPTIDPARGYFPRMQERIETTLGWVNQKFPSLPLLNGSTFELPQIAAITILDWMDKRKITPIENYKNLIEIRNKYSNRPSVISTKIPE